MKKVKITKEQYEKLSSLINEMEGVTGGINRVDKTFKKEFNKVKVKDLSEDKPFNIQKPIAGIPNSKMVKKQEAKPINEDIFSPEVHQAIHNFIQNIWMNPSQKGLDKVFTQHGITWGDIVSYLTSVGILTAVGSGIFKVNNYFKRAFSKDKKEAAQQKVQDIEKMTQMVEKDPASPWNKKLKMQAKPEDDWQAKQKPYNPNRFKPATAMAKTNSYEPHESPTDESIDIGDGSNYSPGTENDPSAPWNQKEPKLDRSTAEKKFTPVALGKELAILQGPDGMYIFDYSNFNREVFPNSNYELEAEDIADFVNENYWKIERGNGLKSFESGADLVKLDDALKGELANLYGKDKKFIMALSSLDEMTGSASSGAFTGPLGAGNANNNVSPDYTPSKQLDETTTTGSDPVSSSQGQYTQPAIWAKDEKNWKGNKKTQWAGGSFVELDNCTKLNNNKKAQQGKCSAGAVDSVVKLKKTKGNVNAPSLGESIYETIAKKTGKTIDEVKNIIETKLNTDLTKN